MQAGYLSKNDFRCQLATGKHSRVSDEWNPRRGNSSGSKKEKMNSENAWVCETERDEAANEKNEQRMESGSCSQIGIWSKQQIDHVVLLSMGRKLRTTPGDKLMTNLCVFWFFLKIVTFTGSSFNDWLFADPEEKFLRFFYIKSERGSRLLLLLQKVTISGLPSSPCWDYSKYLNKRSAKMMKQHDCEILMWQDVIIPVFQSQWNSCLILCYSSVLQKMREKDWILTFFTIPRTVPSSSTLHQQ